MSATRHPYCWRAGVVEGRPGSLIDVASSDCLISHRPSYDSEGEGRLGRGGGRVVQGRPGHGRSVVSDASTNVGLGVVGGRAEGVDQCRTEGVVVGSHQETCRSLTEGVVVGRAKGPLRRTPQSTRLFLVQSWTSSPVKGRKSFGLAVTRMSSFATAIDAI